MPEPIDYEVPRLGKSRKGGELFCVISLLLTALTVYVVIDVLVDAFTILHAGLYRPRVSFFYDLSLKTYHVQRHPLVWFLPLGGAAFGVACLMMRSAWRSWAMTSIAIAFWCAIGMAAMSGEW